MEDQTTILIDSLGNHKNEPIKEPKADLLKDHTILFGTYQVIKTIGTGGMSMVFLAKHIRLGTLWAVKRIDRGQIPDSVFQNEADLLRKLRHPMLPYLVGTHEDETYFYIIEEYIPGQNLRQYMDVHGSVEESTGVNWFLKLCDVLEYLHTRKPAVVYGDMKPANIMLQPDGKLRILDLGISGLETETNRRIDARADIYSLGVTMCELLTGTLPFIGGQSISKNSDKAGLSHSMQYILEKCTQANPDDRYAGISTLRNDLLDQEQIEIKLEKEKRANSGRMLLFCVTGAVALGGALLSISFLARRFGLHSTDDSVIGAASTDSSTIGISTEAALVQEASYSDSGSEAASQSDGSNDPDDGQEENTSVGLEIDPETVAALESLGKSFENQDHEEIFKAIRSERTILDHYLRVHNLDSVYYECGDKLLIYDDPWFYYGESDHYLPNGEGVAASYDRSVKTWTTAQWKNGRIEGEFRERRENTAPTNAEGTFYLSRDRRAQLLEGKYTSEVLEEVVYKTAEEDSLKQIQKNVTPPFSIKYRMNGTDPEALLIDDIPDDVDWINGSRLGTKDVYAFSEEYRLLFYVEDYDEYTYEIGVEKDEE